MQHKREIANLVLVILVLFAPGSISANQESRWQTGWEAFSWGAMFFATGCGTDLYARHIGDALVIQNYEDLGIGMSQHRQAHASASMIASSAYLVSGYHQLKLNRARPTLEFRHRAHNVLFTSVGAGLVVCGISGYLSAEAYERGDLGSAELYARIMQNSANVSCLLGFSDLLLFGGADNATVIGFKIRL